MKSMKNIKSAANPSAKFISTETIDMAEDVDPDEMTEFEAELHQITLDTTLRLVSKGLTTDEAMHIMTGKPFGYDPADLNRFADHMKKLSDDQLGEESASFLFTGNHYALSDLAERKAALLDAEVRLRKRRQNDAK